MVAARVLRRSCLQQALQLVMRSRRYQLLCRASAVEAQSPAASRYPVTAMVGVQRVASIRHLWRPAVTSNITSG
jgi:hypothetical protein